MKLRLFVLMLLLLLRSRPSSKSGGQGVPPSVRAKVSRAITAGHNRLPSKALPRRQRKARPRRADPLRKTNRARIGRARRIRIAHTKTVRPGATAKATVTAVLSPNSARRSGGRKSPIRIRLLPSLPP